MNASFTRTIGLVFWLLLLPGLAEADSVSTERTEATLMSEVNTLHANQTFWVALHIALQPGWHTYWKNPGDSGTAPTFAWTLPNGFTAGDVRYLGPEREKIGPLVDYAYSDNAYYLVPITTPAILRENAMTIIALKAGWLVCKDVCIPEKGELSLVLPSTAQAGMDESPDAPVIKQLVGLLPAEITDPITFSVGGGEVRFDVGAKDIAHADVKSALYFPAEEGLITNAADQRVEIAPGSIHFALKSAEGALPKTSSGLVSLFLANGQRKDYDIRLQDGAVAARKAGTGPTPGGDWLRAAFFAFVGGFLLNLMPCVFPILSLKSLAVVKKAALHPRAVRAQGLAYATGVVLSFLALAALLVVVQRFYGEEIGWGYQMQSPLFVGALAYLLFLVGLNLSGYFEVPSVFAGAGNDAAAREGLLGSFLTGVLAVLVATPCTAPFMAPAVGFALTQDAGVILVVFAALGLGLASPFLLISLFPSLMRVLPKPGAWMLRFRQLLAFPIYVCVVWLLWVLSHEAGADATPVILCGMICLAFSIWLWQRDSSLARFSAMLIAIAAVSLSMAMVHPAPEAASSLKGRAEKFSLARLDDLRKQGVPVFVDATADWCITCKVNESVTLASPEVLQAFDEKHIVYMVADWTRGDADITRYLESFGRRGVPLYVYYPPGAADPVVLPQLLGEKIVLKAVQ